MRPVRIGMPVVAVAVLLASACSDDTPTMPTQPLAPPPLAAPPPQDPGVISSQSGDARTDFQLAIENALAERRAAGLPAPSLSFQYESDAGVPLATLQAQGLEPGEEVTIVATTVIRYDNPQQARRSEWPAFVIEGTVPPDVEGSIQEGDYTQAIKDAVEREAPGFWQTHTFGQEPRTYTYTETITFTHVEDNASGALQGVAAVSATGEVVNGFSIPGPGLDYTLDETLEIASVDVASIRFGFAMDWAFGVRLPMAVSVTGPNSVLEGSSFVPTSIARGLDWTAADFTNAGILPGEGNEFLMEFEFFLGINVEVLGFTVFSLGPDVDIDESSSFTTPLGPGQVFNLPTIDLPIFSRSAGPASFSIGFDATPQAGSDRFTADWLAAGEASGSGAVVYSTSGVSRNLGSVLAIDGPGSANLRLDDFEYVFTQFRIALGLFVQLEVDAGIFGEETWRFGIPITSFNLSSIVPDLAVGLHAGSSPTTVGTAVTIDNVAPTAEIDLSSTTLVNGVPTFLVESGIPHMFTGSSFDPGRDDLTASWDFGDGGGVSTDYPLGAPVGPNQIVDMQAHTFGDACLRETTFNAVDDDGAFGEDQVTVVNTPVAGSNAARQEGYWQHQLRRNGKTDFDDAALECLLAIVGHMSPVFNEVRDASTIEQAHDVMFLKQNRGSEREQLDRELLVVWLNWANGVFGYTEMLDIDRDGVVDASFVDLVTAAETVRRDAGATTAQIKEQTRILHRINTLGPPRA